ncbi:MAG: glycosaminoglycan attachment site [Bacteroidales bacterium]|nr:glycosaminoglycan attachment site [Bacteroidales bacterium]
MFSRTPAVKFFNRELEYYQSDDERLIGFVSLDNIDNTYHAMLFDRNSLGRYENVDMRLDCYTIDDAREALSNMMLNYVRDNAKMKRVGRKTDFFTLVADKSQIHPNFLKLRNEGFFAAAKKVIEEISYHHIDIDGNFTEQLQSINGFDARIWELYLWCYFREENFEFNTKHDVPDFMLNKLGEEVAVEAVHIKRTQGLEEEMKQTDFPAILEKLRNEMPVMFGSPLYSKLKHKYKDKKYWDLPHVKGKPLVFAIADFHADMSMTWSFPAITSILYGTEQMAEKDEDGKVTLVSSFGDKYVKKNNAVINPLFLDDEFKYVSAVLFSPCGTISKFNRMGVQAGYGDSSYTMLQTKICYNHLKNAVYPNVMFNVIDENSCETWADGIQIFHNPKAEIPLNAGLFPHAGHHFYKDGLLYSDMPLNSTISTMTWNVKNMPFKMRNFSFHTREVFDTIVKQYNM